MKNEPINYHGVNFHRDSFIMFIEQLERAYLNGSSFDGNFDKPVAKDLKAKIDHGYKLLNIEPGTIYQHMPKLELQSHLKVPYSPPPKRHKKKHKK